MNQPCTEGHQYENGDCWLCKGVNGVVGNHCEALFETINTECVEDLNMLQRSKECVSAFGCKCTAFVNGWQEAACSGTGDWMSRGRNVYRCQPAAGGTQPPPGG
jgi:hypothetical protein